MPADINVVILSGRLAKDPELITSEGKQDKLLFTVASDRQRKDQHTSFIDCMLFGTDLAALHASLPKGKKVTLQGELSQSRWTDKDRKHRSKISILVSSIDYEEDKRKQSCISAEDPTIPF